MDTDLILTIGVVLLFLSIPSLLSAYAETRAPRLGGVMLFAAIALIMTALMSRTGGYSFNEIPGVIVAVVMRLVS